MVHVVDSVAALQTWLPRLTELLENNAVLVVLDNLESLLSESGGGGTSAGALLIDALLTPGGLSRTVLTSRIRPAGLPASIETIPVHALPLDEALLLVRELPNLRRLLDGKAPGIAADAGRRTGAPHAASGARPSEADRVGREPGRRSQRLAAQLDRADAAQTAGASSTPSSADGETRLRRRGVHGEPA